MAAVAVIGAPAFAESHAEGDLIFLDQGWTEEQRQFYYHGSQGTAMLPLAFWKGLEQADSDGLFSDPDYYHSLGLLKGEQSDEFNPEGLPVGLALNRVEDGVFKGDWVGLTCSSCHSAELYYEGKTIRIDGGSNHIYSMPRFTDEVRKATHATLDDEAKFDRFYERVKDAANGMSKDEVREELKQASVYIDYFVDRVAGSPHDLGPGRMDAVTQIPNTIDAVYPEVPENVEMGMSPTKSPFVWNAPQSAWVQWGGILHRPITRNLGESLGAMVRVNMDPDEGELFESTVTLREQHQLEVDIRELEAPQWPAEVFGEIDQDLAAKGKELVAENCSSCHTSYPYRWSPERMKGKRFVENGMVPLAYMGTDPMWWASPTADPRPGKWTGLMQEHMPNKEKAASSGDIQVVLKTGVIDKYISELNLTEDEWLAWNNYSDPSDGLTEEGAPTIPTYKAAPLEGMWATGPFLHNGAIPTIYELLLPASERQEKWVQGREFDPKKLGVVTEEGSGDYTFDTTLVGMSNAGHSFEDAPLGRGVVGRALSEEERYAIIEYLKTLPNGPNQEAPYGGPEGEFDDAWADGSNYFNAVKPSGYFNGQGEAPKGYVSTGEVTGEDEPTKK
ncbi:di-heme-cytochrome C peroxidase [Palleronia caenipelagi]|uniref:Cytochrome c domain-containing protein n=1 Tax=Palleronia caenipelagi TaxID=2489174 RepID=A0A547Q2M9_9RHOB|nr:di-heme-cytochrome C peroxidase [Palleronia caenipelagi]TRD20647.1 hypothetical protein FEV53_10140 [Palleronia caenipelagi]